MRLSWKIFFITTPIFVLFLTVFGAWILEDSFANSLSQEVERCMTENQMFQNSYELTKHSLSQSQEAQTTIKSMVESFHKKQGAETGNTRLYGEDGEVLYQDNGLRVELERELLGQLDEENNVGYELGQMGKEMYLVVLGRSRLGIYIETTRNISEIFRNRMALYSRYQTGAIVLAAMVGVVILLILFLTMRNMQKLSQATRQYARGQYDTRVKISSNDEIGMLAADFNWMANAMNNQMERLEHEVHRQEEFTAAFAHELKTPLTSIIGYADTIRQMELPREETAMCADYIFHQGKRLQTLSYKLLEMTMTEKQVLAFREIDVSDFFAELERTAQPSLEAKQQRLVVQVEEGFLYGDRDLLASLFLNLVDNARKAMEPGKCVFITGTKQPGGYCVVVEDEGSGLAREELTRITEAFYMVDKSRSRKEGGAGLGLALCQKIVELHGAAWQFESEPGQGLRVTVLFGSPEPARRPRRERRAKVAAAGKRSGRGRKAEESLRDK